jgi:hypothetical protein
VTEKAFPEDEWVVSSSVNARGNPGVTSNFVYEKRFGVKNQIEIKGTVRVHACGTRKLVWRNGRHELGTQELARGQNINWHVLPQLQVTLNKRSISERKSVSGFPSTIRSGVLQGCDDR